MGLHCLLLGLLYPNGSPSNLTSAQEPEGAFENANLILSPPTRTFNGSPYCSDGGKISKSCAVWPLPFLCTHPLCTPATLAFSQTPSSMPSSFKPQGLCICCSLTGTLIFTFAPTKPYLSRLTPVPQFSPPPGHSPWLTSLGKSPSLYTVVNHPFTWPVILNPGHILESPRESLRTWMPKPQPRSRISKWKGGAPIFLRSPPGDSSVRPQWRIRALSQLPP